tara:strand:- start:525 stop:770 length:246 start_codon:yes stop_codon:yes gene_type:complete
MSLTEEHMFDIIKSKYNANNVTVAMCVNSFNDYKKGDQKRDVLVDLACKMLFCMWKQGKYGDDMNEDEVALLVNHFLTYKE